MADKIILDVFNPVTQEVAPHELTIDKNNDYLLKQVDQNDDDEWEVVEGGHFVKYPSNLSPEELRAELKKYQKANEGQVNVEGLERENAAKLDAFRDNESQPTPEVPESENSEHVDSAIPAPMPSGPGNEGLNDTQSVVGPE